MNDGTYRGRWIGDVFRAPVSAELQVFLLWLAYYYMSPAGKVCEPRAQLADHFGCHPRKITAKFRAAIDAGLLEQTVRGQKGQTAEYRAVVQGARTRHPETVQGASSRHPERTLQGDKNGHPETPQGDHSRHPERPSGCQQSAPLIYKGVHVAEESATNSVVPLFKKEHTPARVRARVSEPQPGEHPDFAEWYAAYPLHKARGAAARAYARAVRKTSPQVLLEAARRYRDDPNRNPKYTKHPATWLNGECWLDEPEPAPATVTPITHAERLTGTDARVAGWAAIAQQLGEQETPR